MEECSIRFPVKGWHRLTEDNSVVWCGVQYMMRKQGNTVQYGITQRDEIKEFLDMHGYTGVQQVLAPMQGRKELYSDDRGVTAEEHAWLRSVIGSLSYYAEKTM